MTQRQLRGLAFLALTALLLSGCATGVLVGGGKGSEQAARYPAENDARITNEVDRRLVADPRVPAMDVNVETLQGIVTLTGELPNRAARDQAERTARAVPGVKRGRNPLRIAR